MPQLSLVSQFGSPTLTSLRVTGNTIMGNNLNVIGSVTVSGSLTAQSLIVNSTNVITGSTKFGSVSTNTHQFTGSVLVTGSMNVVGSVTATSFAGSGASLTSIPNSALNNSTISGISLGSNLATLTIGTGLSGTSYNGSTGVTIANTGVTSIVAGTGISINQGTGAVTVTNTINNTNQLTNGAGFITGAGNAATATKLSSGQTNWSGTGIIDNAVGMIAWKNYGNNHVIFDASNSKTPSGTDCNNTNPGVAWTGTYPTLMGWNGTNTYGVRVDSAKVADSANSVAWTNVSSRPTALSSFTNDLGNYGSWITSAGTAAAINQTVAVDTNANLVYSQMGSNDFFRIRVGGGSNAGYVEIATADDGTEPIYIRQYTGVFTDVTRTATILDGSGNTTFPGAVTANSFSGTSYWTNISGRPTALSQLTNDLGNYGNWYSNNGGTISGNVTINGSSNTVLTLNAAEPHIRIAATGGSNVAGVVIVPTSGYDAFVGNFNNGATNIMANSVKIGQFRKDTYFTPNDGNHDLKMGDGTPSTQGAISLYGSNSGAGYEGRLNCLNNDGNTHFYHRNNNAIFTDIGYFNESGMYISYYGSYSDIRLKDVIETNPSSSLDNIDVIKYTLKSHPSLTRYGYSAQQVQSVLPDLVTINSPISGSADEGTLMLNYNDLHVLKIAALERKVAQLEADIAALKL